MRKFVLGPNAARSLKRILRGAGEVSRRKSLGDALAFSPEYVAPFTVQWAQSVADGDGAWIIWIPGDGCLTVDGESVDLTEDLEAAGGDYPSGWYILDCLESSGGSLYLEVQIPVNDDDDDDEGEGIQDREITAEFSSGSDASSDDDETTRTIRVLIATASVGASGDRNVLQNVTSAIVMSSGDVGKLVKSLNELSGKLTLFIEEGLLKLKKDGSEDDGDDVEIGKVVETLNDTSGGMDIIGGQKIRVETSGQTIKISYDENKDEDDEDPNDQEDPCEHAGGGGGVKPDDDKDGHGGAGGGGGGGGVPGDGGHMPHPGDDDCNCD